MHLEIPKARIESFKDFAKHYLMIVLSILTALGLEAWIEHSHHVHAAATASQQIETELRGNLEGVRTSLKYNNEKLASLEQLDALVTADLKSGMPSATINEHIRSHRDLFKLSMSWPTLASQGWEVAAANQSAGWIDEPTLRRYATAYTSQRDMDSWEVHNSGLLVDVPRLTALNTRIKLGLDVDPVEFLTTVEQMIDTMNEVKFHLEQLEPRLEGTLRAHA